MKFGHGVFTHSVYTHTHTYARTHIFIYKNDKDFIWKICVLHLIHLSMLLTQTCGMKEQANIRAYKQKHFLANLNDE